MRDFALFLEKNMGNMGHFQPISPYFFQIFTPCDVVSKKKEIKRVAKISGESNHSSGGVPAPSFLGSPHPIGFAPPPF